MTKAYWPKAYWIAHITVTNPAAYELYRAANALREVASGGDICIIEGWEG